MFPMLTMLCFQCAFETELASVSTTAKQLESQPVTGSDWTVFHASLRLLQAIGNSQPIQLALKPTYFFHKASRSFSETHIWIRIMINWP